MTWIQANFYLFGTIKTIFLYALCDPPYADDRNQPIQSMENWKKKEKENKMKEYRRLDFLFLCFYSQWHNSLHLNSEFWIELKIWNFNIPSCQHIKYDPFKSNESEGWTTVKTVWTSSTSNNKWRQKSENRFMR